MTAEPGDGAGFAFHADAAAALVSRALLRYEGRAAGGPADEKIALPPDWDPRRMPGDEMWRAQDLVAAAFHAGAITGPGTVTLECSPDDDGGTYLWRVALPRLGFSLSSLYHSYARHLGDGTTGASGARSVIREAATGGTSILTQYRSLAWQVGAASARAGLRRTARHLVTGPELGD